MLATAQITARHIMATKLITLRPDMDAFEAIGRLLRRKVSGAPVVDDEGRFVGIFSEQSAIDMLVDAAYEQHPVATIRQFINADVHTVGPDVDLLTIAQMLLHSNQRRLPVLEEERLLGQVSRRDVLRAAHSLSDQMPQLSPATGPAPLYLSGLHEFTDARFT